MFYLIRIAILFSWMISSDSSQAQNPNPPTAHFDPRPLLIECERSIDDINEYLGPSDAADLNRIQVRSKKARTEIDQGNGFEHLNTLQSILEMILIFRSVEPTLTQYQIHHTKSALQMLSQSMLTLERRYGFQKVQNYRIVSVLMQEILSHLESIFRSTTQSQVRLKIEQLIPLVEDAYLKGIFGDNLSTFQSGQTAFEAFQKHYQDLYLALSNDEAREKLRQSHKIFLQFRKYADIPTSPQPLPPPTNDSPVIYPEIQRATQ